MRTGLFLGLIIALLMANTRISAATGGFWCQAEDKSLRFTVHAGLSHGIGGGFLRFSGDLEIRLSGIPDDFRKLHFDETAVSQWWLDDKDFKLRLYRERETGPSGYVVLVILTKAISEGDYHGEYGLSVYSMQFTDAAGKNWEERGGMACLID